MGVEKSALIEREEKWHYKAKQEGFRCAVCSQVVAYDEREVYFRTKMCGYCAHVMAKDD